MSSTPPAAPPAPVELGQFRRKRRPAWVVITATLAPIVGVFGFAMWKYASADHLGVLDNPPVVERASIACKQLERDTQPSPGSPVTIIRDQDAAIDVLINSMEQLGTRQLRGDNPALGWIGDWRILRDARAKYADELAATSADAAPVPFTVPTADGEPITTRMSQVGVNCPVVWTLAAPPS